MFVKRDTAGAIVSLSRTANSECREAVADDDADLIAFLNAVGNPFAHTLHESDLEVIRVLDDLVEILTDKGVVQFTDLPEPAQKKLLGRRSLRQSARGLSLICDDEDGLV